MDLPAINCYVIRVTTIDNLYVDYMVEAKNICQANIKARRAFFRDFPNANFMIKTSVVEPSPKIITEIMNIIKEANNGNNIVEMRHTTSDSK